MAAVVHCPDVVVSTLRDVLKRLDTGGISWSPEYRNIVVRSIQFLASTKSVVQSASSYGSSLSSTISASGAPLFFSVSTSSLAAASTLTSATSLASARAFPSKTVLSALISAVFLQKSKIVAGVVASLQALQAADLLAMETIVNVYDGQAKREDSLGSAIVVTLCSYCSISTMASLQHRCLEFVISLLKGSAPPRYMRDTVVTRCIQVGCQLAIQNTNRETRRIGGELISHVIRCVVLAFVGTAIPEGFCNTFTSSTLLDDYVHDVDFDDEFVPIEILLPCESYAAGPAFDHGVVHRLSSDLGRSGRSHSASAALPPLDAGLPASKGSEDRNESHSVPIATFEISENGDEDAAAMSSRLASDEVVNGNNSSSSGAATEGAPTTASARKQGDAEMSSSNDALARTNEATDPLFATENAIRRDSGSSVVVDDEPLLSSTVPDAATLAHYQHSNGSSHPPAQHHGRSHPPSYVEFSEAYLDMTDRSGTAPPVGWGGRTVSGKVHFTVRDLVCQRAKRLLTSHDSLPSAFKDFLILIRHTCRLATRHLSSSSESHQDVRVRLLGMHMLKTMFDTLPTACCDVEHPCSSWLYLVLTLTRYDLCRVITRNVAVPSPTQLFSSAITVLERLMRKAHYYLARELHTLLAVVVFPLAQSRFSSFQHKYDVLLLVEQLLGIPHMCVAFFVNHDCNPYFDTSNKYGGMLELLVEFTNSMAFTDFRDEGWITPEQQHLLVAQCVRIMHTFTESMNRWIVEDPRSYNHQELFRQMPNPSDPSSQIPPFESNGSAEESSARDRDGDDGSAQLSSSTRSELMFGTESGAHGMIRRATVPANMSLSVAGDSAAAVVDARHASTVNGMNGATEQVRGGMHLEDWKSDSDTEIEDWQGRVRPPPQKRKSSLLRNHKPGVPSPRSANASIVDAVDVQHHESERGDESDFCLNVSPENDVCRTGSPDCEGREAHVIDVQDIVRANGDAQQSMRVTAGRNCQIQYHWKHIHLLLSNKRIVQRAVEMINEKAWKKAKEFLVGKGVIPENDLTAFALFVRLTPGVDRMAICGIFERVRKDAECKAVAVAYFGSFNYRGIPMDVALRDTTCDFMSWDRPVFEAQVWETLQGLFGVEYARQNPHFITTSDAEALAGVLLFLHTSVHNENARSSKMTMEQFVRDGNACLEIPLAEEEMRAIYKRVADRKWELDALGRTPREIEQMNRQARVSTELFLASQMSNSIRQGVHAQSTTMSSATSGRSVAAASATARTDTAKKSLESASFAQFLHEPSLSPASQAPAEEPVQGTASATSAATTPRANLSSPTDSTTAVLTRTQIQRASGTDDRLTVGRVVASASASAHVPVGQVCDDLAPATSTASFSELIRNDNAELGGAPSNQSDYGTNVCVSTGTNPSVNVSTSSKATEAQRGTAAAPLSRRLPQGTLSKDDAKLLDPTTPQYTAAPDSIKPRHLRMQTFMKLSMTLVQELEKEHYQQMADRFSVQIPYAMPFYAQHVRPMFLLSYPQIMATAYVGLRVLEEEANLRMVLDLFEHVFDIASAFVLNLSDLHVAVDSLVNRSLSEEGAIKFGYPTRVAFSSFKMECI